MDESENSTKDEPATSNEASKVLRKSVDITPERDKGILKEIRRQGTGDECPLKGDTVYIHYIGRLEDGTEFDSSRKGSSKFQLVLDSRDGMSVDVFVLNDDVLSFCNRCGHYITGFTFDFRSFQDLLCCFPVEQLNTNIPHMPTHG